MRLGVVVIALVSIVIPSHGDNSLMFNLQNIANEAIEARRRKDAEMSLVCIAQMVTGFALMYQPPRKDGMLVVEPEVGASTLELFVTYKFYERLLGRLLGIEAFAVAGEERRIRAQKRGRSLVLFGTAFGTARLAVRSSSTLSLLGPRLFLGAATARTCIAVADHLAAEIMREITIRRATRAIVTWDRREEEHSEYAEAAYAAVRKAVKAKESQRPPIEAPPLIQLVVALLSTALSIRIVGNSPRIPQPTIFAPSLLGAFEVARGSRDLFRANEFLFVRYMLRIGTYLGIKLERPLMIIISILIDILGRLGSFLALAFRGVGQLLALAVNACEHLQLKLFSNRYAIYDFVQNTPGLKQAFGLAWRIARFPRFAAKTYSRYVKRLQRTIKAFLWENHDVLWPYALAWSSYKFRTGQISFFPGVPKFLAYLAALPTVTVAKLSARLANMARHFLTIACLAFFNALLTIVPVKSATLPASATPPTFSPSSWWSPSVSRLSFTATSPSSSISSSSTRTLTSSKKNA